MLKKIKEMSGTLKAVLGAAILLISTTVTAVTFFPKTFVTTKKHETAVAELRGEIQVVSNDTKLNTLKDLERELISDIIRTKKLLKLEPNNEEHQSELEELRLQLQRVSDQIRELEQ